MTIDTGPLVPSYITIDSQGRIGAKFTGGVQLTEHVHGGISPVPAPDSSALAWVRSDGSIAAEIYEDRNVTNPITPVERLELNAYQDAAGHNAGINASVLSSALALLANILLIDYQGQSDFLQLASTAKLEMDWGTASIGHTAQAANSVTVAHRLGRAPALVLATINQVVAGATGTVYASGFTSTQFTLGDVWSANLNSAISYGWIALG